MEYTKIYTLNDYSNNRDFPFVGYSCMCAKIGELRLQTHIIVSFQYAICVYLYT